MQFTHTKFYWLLCLLLLSQFSFASSIRYGTNNCSFVNGGDLGTCYLNMTGEDLSQMGINVIELAIYHDGSRDSSAFQIKNLPHAQYVVIETSTAEMNKNAQRYLSHGLMCLGKVNPHPMQNCDVEMNHKNFGVIKIIQKNNNRYHC